MFRPEFDSRKFRGMILYVADHARRTGDKYFGAVKLNKILYYSDFIAFQRFNFPITGASYQKLREGPAPRELLPERKSMIDAGLVELKQVPVFNYVQSRLVPLADSVDPLQWLTQDEVDVIDLVLAEFNGMTGAELSERSHKEQGWILADEGEYIPYETASLEPMYGDGNSEIDMRRDA